MSNAFNLISLIVSLVSLGLCYAIWRNTWPPRITSTLPPPEIITVVEQLPPLPCNEPHLSQHTCAPCREAHLADHTCPRCTEEHLADHVCSLCSKASSVDHVCLNCLNTQLAEHVCVCTREHLDNHECFECDLEHVKKVYSDTQLYFCDVEYMPGNPFRAFGVVVRSFGPNGSVICYQDYMSVTKDMNMTPHPEQKEFESRLASYFHEPCTFVFWDGRNDTKTVKFPANVYKRDLAPAPLWGGRHGEYASLSAQSVRVGYRFGGHHAAQFETNVSSDLLVFMAQHWGKTIVDSVNSLPFVI